MPLPRVRRSAPVSLVTAHEAAGSAVSSMTMQDVANGLAETSATLV
jgi:hypothetical protein